MVFAAAPLCVPAASPEWIWATENRSENQIAVLRKSFSVHNTQRAVLRAVTDFCDAKVSINGKRAAFVENYGPLVEMDVTTFLRDGDNEIMAVCHGDAAAPAVSFEIEFTDKRGAVRSVASDATWLSVLTGMEDWHPAISFGRLAPQPWGRQRNGTFSAGIDAFDDYTQWKQATGAKAGADPSTFLVAPGFEIQLLYSAKANEGSWVSMDFDPQGRLVIAREDQGLLQLEFAADGTRTKVKMINDSLKESRGLLHAFGALYANANNSKGLFRLRAGRSTMIFKTEGGVGHGRNDLALGSDQMIYAIHGDAVDLPRDLPDRTSRYRQHDWLRPAKQGFVVRLDQDGNKKEIFSAGLRNPYGIAANHEGELFTYDADAEFDMGSPWYRPTRVRHLVSGADYGWRAVTKQWPPFFPDSADNPPSNLDVGRGSPTAVKFGTNSHFPAKFRSALFILDWTYGRVLAIHMTSRGASYACRAETFVKGRPLNVTDLDFGPDGAMYLVTGGRKTQSALYRIRYTGPADDPRALTEQEQSRFEVATQQRALRRKLESFHGRQHGDAVDTCWPHLASSDPWIRHAARVAIEHQPVAMWQVRALEEKQTEAALCALLALSRGGPSDVLERILARVNELQLPKLPTSQKFTALRIYDLCLERNKSFDDGIKTQLISHLDRTFPSSNTRLNWKFCELLLKLDAPRALRKAIPLLVAATNQKDRLYYLFALRNLRDGWTVETRRSYFLMLRHAETFVGGEGMPGFVSKIRSEAIATLADDERQQLAALIESTSPSAAVATAARPFVKEWKFDDLASKFDQAAQRRDRSSGKKMFVAARCADCHRVGSIGNVIGPDLTSVASRFSRRDILRAILEPSLVIAPQYRNVEITTTDGKLIVGRMVLSGDFRRPTLHLITDPINPSRVVKIKKQEIESHRLSAISPMPNGLLNTLSEAEILDLLAFLEDSGRSDNTR
jgi:hypothetical protein